MIRATTVNVDWGLRPQQVAADVDRLDYNTDLIHFQEAKRVRIESILNDKWKVHQNTTTDALQGSGVAWRKDKFKVVAKGRRLGVRAGNHDMLDRWIFWVVLEDRETGFRFKAASAHLPPKDTWVLHPAMMRSLSAMIKRSKAPVLIGADWNKHEHDLGPLGEGGSYHMHHIDGFWVPRQLDVEFLTTGPNTASDHLPVRIGLKPKN